MSRCCECRRCERAPEEASGLGWLWTRIVEPLIGGVVSSSVVLYLCDQYLVDIAPMTLALGTIGFTAWAILDAIFADRPRRTD